MAGEGLDIDKLLEESLEATKEKKAPSPPVREPRVPNTDVTKEKEESDRKRKRSSSRSRSRERKRRRSRERSKERDRNRDKRSHRERSSSREDRRRSSRERSKDRRDRDRDRDRDRRKSPDRRGGRSSRSDREQDRKKEPSPNPDEATRGARTVFAYNLPTKANSQDIWKFFEQAGKVRDVRLIQDRNSRKSKGFGYIEMDSINAVTAAIQLSGTQMMGKTVMVQASQAERNEAQTQQKQQQQQPTRLYIGGLHTNVTEQDVQSMFAEFGEVDFVDLHREPETGNSKGFAFVQFRDPEAAKRALVQVNGREMAGRTLKVGLVNTATGKGGSGLGEMDEEGVGNLSMDAQSRAILMAKLQRSEDKGGSSTCIILKNMFTTEEANEPNFEQELTEDVKEECGKHGQVRHMYIDRYSQNGVVYVRFVAVSQATAAVNELNGRWFGGRQIEALYVPEGTYLTKFPHAR